MKKFVLVCYGRTGSTLLVDALARHPSLRMYGEVFHDDEAARRDIYSVDGRPWAGEDGREFVRDVVYAPRPGVFGVGFKFMYHHAVDPRAATALDYLVETRDVAVLFLTRDDLLSSLVSLECATRSSVWQVSRDAGPVPELQPFRLEKVRCDAYFERIPRLTREMRARFAAHPVLDLVYERDIEPGYATALEMIQRFLGVDVRDLESSLRKTGRRSVREQIENFDELSRQFAGTPHARWFVR